MIKKIGVLLLLFFACNVYADIEVTGKFAPKNNGFTGLIDADQILGGSVRIPTNTIPTHIYISSISSVDGLNWIGIYINDIEVSSFTVSGFHTSVINWADGTVQVSSPTAGGGGGGTPGGSDTEIQYNNSTAFGGVSNFTFNGTTVAITIPFEVSTITWLNGTVQVSSPAASLWQTESDGVALLVDDELLIRRNIELTATNAILFRYSTIDQSSSGSINSHTGGQIKIAADDQIDIFIGGVGQGSFTASGFHAPASTFTHTYAVDYSSAGTFYGDGSNLTGISAGGSPGGANTNVQFNDSGSFLGDSGMTYTKATSSFSVSGFVTAGTLNMTAGSITDTSGAIDFGNENITSAGTWTAGTDGTGDDWVWYGDLTGRYMTWSNNQSALIMNNATKIQYGDSGTYINQSADGTLALVSDTNITITADVLTTIGVAGDIVLGDATQRVTRPHTDNQMHLGTVDYRFEDGWFTELHVNQSTNNVSNPPTDAQLDTAFGTPASLGRGFLGTLDDASGNTDVWFCFTTDTSWFYIKGTKAP